MHDFAMTSDRIFAAIDQAVATKGYFLLVISDMYGEHTDYGRHMTEPLPGSIMYDCWEGASWRTTSLLSEHQMIAMWTEHDWCSCRDHIVNLETYRADSEPLCDVCDRVAYESARGDSLAADGGL